MPTLWRSLALILLTGATPALALAGEAGDLVFAARGPWGAAPLSWALTREGPAVPGFLPATAGRVTLAGTTDPSDGQPMVGLTQRTDAGERRIGPFPVSGGDPAVVFFLENTARDMALLTGGSPDYIRNRIKDALFRGGRVIRADRQVTVEMQPFAGDPNAARMGGFDSLTLRFGMGDNPAAPIRELVAETAGPVTVAAPPGLAAPAPARYRHAMVLE